jgi:hypothetical protein
MPGWENGRWAAFVERTDDGFDATVFVAVTARGLIVEPIRGLELL